LYNIDEDIISPCHIIQYGNECQVFSEEGTLIDTVDSVNLIGLTNAKCKLTEGSYLETLDNKVYTVSGELRIPTVILRAIVSDDVQLSLDEHVISKIDLENETISGSFGQLQLNDRFNMGVLDLGKGAIKLISGTTNEEFVKKLNANATLKRIFGSVADVLANVQGLDLMSENAIVEFLNNILSDKKYDIGKW
jgi:hypothetical protein